MIGEQADNLGEAFNDLRTETVAAGKLDLAEATATVRAEMNAKAAADNKRPPQKQPPHWQPRKRPQPKPQRSPQPSPHTPRAPNPSSRRRAPANRLPAVAAGRRPRHWSHRSPERPLSG